VSQHVRVTEAVHGTTAVAAVHGEVDASNVEAVGMRLRTAVSNQSLALVIDLTGTDYVDSAGINLLFELAADLGQRQQKLHLVVPDAAPIRRALAITGLDAAVPTHATRDAALAAAAPPDRADPRPRPTSG
jgi:anti-anti-sigma factor